MPGLCVILALGTQEELNEYLLTKSRLKVIQDIRQNFSVSTVLFVLWKLKRETLTYLFPEYSGERKPVIAEGHTGGF